MLDLLRLFVKVVEEQSFTATARKLGITQPAVSNNIRALEDKLGAELLARRTKRLSLTPAGELVFRRAQNILTEWTNLRNELGGLRAEVVGKVTIAASNIPGEYLLPCRLAAFQAAYPKVSLKICVGDSVAMLNKVLSEEADFAVVGSPVDTGKLEAVLWLDDELMLIVPADWPLASSETLSLDELMRYPLIVREPGSGHRRALEEALHQQGLRLSLFSVSLEIGSTEAVKNAVRAGLGYAFVSKWALGDTEAAGLRALTVPGLTMKRAFYLIKPRESSLALAAGTCYHYLLSGSES